jgi:MFS family permease
MVLTAISSGLSAFVGYAMLSWNPPMLERVKGMSLKEVAGYYSIVLGVTGVIGTFAAGWLVDKLGHRDRRWYAWVPALAFVLTLPALAGVLWAPTWQIALAFLAVPALLNNMYLAPALTVVQNAAPPSRRTMAGATLLFILNLVGLGGGPVYVGHISDMAKARYGDHSLLIGFAALFPVILLTIGAHLLAAASIARDKRLAAAL